MYWTHTFHVNYIFHYCHNIGNKIIPISIHQPHFWLYLLGMVKHPKEFFMCKYNERSGFWDIGDRKVSLMFWAIQTLHLIFQHSPPPNPKMTKTWQSCNRPVSVRYTFSTGKSKYLSAQQNYHFNEHSVLACTKSQLRLLYVSAICFAYILKISPNFKTCSNLEPGTHHNPLWCHQFVLHGFAYLFSTSRTWH